MDLLFKTFHNLQDSQTLHTSVEYVSEFKTFHNLQDSQTDMCY